MELVGSLPCSQELSTGPYPEPDQSNLYHPILSLCICMYVCVGGGPNQPLHRDPQWSIVLSL
jgi:hypothetical protein